MNSRIDELKKTRKRSSIIRLSITIAILIGIVLFYCFSSFLQTILEDFKKNIFLAILITGFVLFAVYLILFIFLKLSDKDACFMALEGTKSEEEFYKLFKEESSTEEIEKLDNENNDVEEQPKKEKQKKYKYEKNGFILNLVHNIVDFYDVILLAILIVIFIFTFIMFPATVKGDCMKPLLYSSTETYSGDKILAIKSKKFDVGDVVVFEYDANIQNPMAVSARDKLLVKRVIARGGDKFECINGKIYINDVMIDEEYVVFNYTSSINYDVESISKRNAIDIEITGNIVPEGYCILLGDNRVVANDSHLFGLVKEDQICGVVKLYCNQKGWHKIK